MALAKAEQQRQHQAAHQQPRRRRNADADRASENSQQETQGDRENIDDDYALETERVGGVQGHVSGQHDNQVDADPPAERESGEEEHDARHRGVAAADATRGDGTIALDCMRAVGVAVDPVVADIYGACDQTKCRERGGNVRDEHGVVPFAREYEASPDEGVLHPLLRS